MNGLPRLPLIVTAVVCLLAGLALGWLRLRHAWTADAPTPITCTARFTDHAGVPVQLTDCRGKVVLLYFGYTFCPDICPTELGYMARLLDALGPQAGRIIPVFISVDPERDTPAKLAEYVPLFHPRLRAWSGDATQIRLAADAFGAYYDKVQPAGGKPGHYLMNHTSTIFLLDGQGHLVGRFDSHTPLDEALTLLRKAL